MLCASNRKVEVKEPGVRERKTRAIAVGVHTLWECPRCAHKMRNTPTVHRDGPEHLVRNQITFVYIFTSLLLVSNCRNIQFSKS